MGQELTNITPSKEPARRLISFIDSEVKMIEMLVISGYTPSEIADKVFGCVEKTFLWNLARECNKKAREVYDRAMAKVVSDATASLKKIADGYGYTEKEFKQFLQPMAEEYFEENRTKISELAVNGKSNEFMSFILNGMLGEIDGVVKITEKYEKPDFRAAQKILEAHRPDMWDLEGKRKAIPTSHIIVKIEGEPQRQRKVEANYVVET